MPTEKTTWKLGGDDVLCEKHPSFGMLQISRVQGSPGKLFGSSIEVHNFIQLRIHRGSVSRSLNQDWYHADTSALIEINMSANQFAEAITTLNCGAGVPVTIESINGKRIEECPATNKLQQIKDEFDDTMSKLAKKFSDGVVRINELLESKSLNKEQKKEIAGIVGLISSKLESTLPFIHSQFDEAMDKTVQEAKAEVDAFVTHAIVSTGLAALRGEQVVSVPMLEDDKENHHQPDDLSKD